VNPSSQWVFPSTRRAIADPAIRRALGPLAALSDDQAITDIFVTSDGRVFADRGSGAVVVTGLQLGQSESTDLARGLIEEGGRHLDEASPMVDVRLAAGMRVHAVLPPVAVGGPTVSIRFSRQAMVGVDDLELQWSDQQRQQVLSAVKGRQTLLISGVTGSGKTTLLGALLSRVSPRDRLVVLEDVSEIIIDHPHVVQLECRQPNLEGAGEVTLDRLVRESLRMRPTRLVVGECRGAEFRDLLAAFTTGHSGGATTIHAQSLDELPPRLEALGVMAGLSPDQVARQVASAIDLVIHVEKRAGQTRHLTLGRCTVGEDGRLVASTI
jgi:pilus assembly protein CpaF